MQQPDLIQILLGSNVVDTDIKSIPILQSSLPKELTYGLSASGNDPDENTSPFSFTPQQIRLTTDHEIFEDGDIHRHLYIQDLAVSVAEDPLAPTVSEFRCHIAGCSQLFDSLEGYEHHYNSLHRNVCSTCKRSFPSNRLLDVHILEWHDSLFQVMAEKQCMYQCLVEGCDSKFKTSQERKDHLIRAHSYPPDFRFDRSKKVKSKTKEKKNLRQKDTSMEISDTTISQGGEPESSESMDFSLTPEAVQQEPANTNPSPQGQQKPRYSYKVPPSICFGQGSVRGFRGGRRKK